MGVFPDFIQKIPSVDYGIEGLEVHRDKTSTGLVYFVHADRLIPFPKHSHNSQWTIVVSGMCEFTANGKTTVYKAGDVYQIPAGLEHQITLHPGYAEVDYVDGFNG